MRIVSAMDLYGKRVTRMSLARSADYCGVDEIGEFLPAGPVGLA
ncbi:MAG: hypothetical protein ACRD1T_27035 [Acidimicrobiia bacterium]